MRPSSPDRLWQRWLEARDGAAFEALVRPELRYAFAFARRSGATEAEAEDALQAALLELAREDSETPVSVGLRAWLCRRVRLSTGTQIRSAVRRRAHERRAPPTRPAPPPGRLLEARDEVEAALAGLAEDERSAITLRYLLDLEYRQVALVLGVSEGAARLRVHRALTALRAQWAADPRARLALLGLPALPTSVASLQFTNLLPAAAGGAASAAGASPIPALKLGVWAAGLGALGVAGVLSLSRPPSEAPALAQAPASPGPPVAVLPPAPSAPAAAAPGPVAPARSFPALDLLDAHFDGRAPADAVLWDHGRILALLGTQGAGPTTRVQAPDGTAELDLQELAQRFERIELGPGEFRVRRGLRVLPGALHPRLDLVGAGAERTRLRTRDGAVVLVEGTLASLSIRELTFAGAEPGARSPGGLLDVRGRCAASLERLRLESFATGAGYSAPVGHTGRVLLAWSETSVVGGVRRRPSGFALAVRGEALYLFHRCHLVDLEAAVVDASGGAGFPRNRGWFHGTRFADTRLCRETHGQAVVTGQVGPYPIEVRGGSVAYGVRGEPEAGPRKRWTERGQVAADVAWEFEPVRATLDDVRLALEGFHPSPGTRLIAMEACAWLDGPRPTFVAHVQSAEGLASRQLVDGQGRPVDPEVSAGFDLSAALSVAPPPGADLQQVWASLEQIPFDLGWPAGSIALHRSTDGSPLVVALDRFGRQR